MEQHSQIDEPTKRVIFEVKTPRTSEETPEAMVQFLLSLTSLERKSMWKFSQDIAISLELAVHDQTIHFYVTAPASYRSYIESQLLSQYPKAFIATTKDYLDTFLLDLHTIVCGQVKLAKKYWFPLKTYVDFKDVDALSSLLGIMSKAEPDDHVSIQIILLPTDSGWQHTIESALQSVQQGTNTSLSSVQTKVMHDKIAFPGFACSLQVLVHSGSKTRSEVFLRQIISTFSTFLGVSGNSLRFSAPYFWQQKRLIQSIKQRDAKFVSSKQILNVSELATIFHFPTMQLATIKNLSWQSVILSDAPSSLPIAEGMTPEQKVNINFFARTEFKNKMTSFGIKSRDRRKHFYIIGKTGTGKSTLIANMAISDMRNRRGFCIIDPHGDLCEIILRYVPSYRVNDLIYFDPSDAKHTLALNPLEVENPAQKELAVSGIIAIFYKLYGFSWGPRLEYILRNALLSVIDLPNSTLLMIPQILTDDGFRKKVVAELKDPVLKNFWTNEFDKMQQNTKIESVSPILNKIGQFISSQVIRNIINKGKSSIALDTVMNEGKIMLVNLSQGKIGEDNAALLGAMLITKIQLAAMNRVNIPEDQRRDFYLYVDEFQNFATTSFIKILSEARKYRLNLTLANQYIAQVPEEVRAAIFGNTGTILAFTMGAADSAYMVKEFGERFKEDDLIALQNYQAIIKMTIDDVIEPPFVCQTLPLLDSITQNRDKVMRVSSERFTRYKDAQPIQPNTQVPQQPQTPPPAPAQTPAS